MVLALGMLDSSLDVIDRDERAASVEGGGTEAARWRGFAITLVREAEPDEAVDLGAQCPVPVRAPTHQLSYDVCIEHDVVHMHISISGNMMMCALPLLFGNRSARGSRGARAATPAAGAPPSTTERPVAATTAAPT